MTFQPVQEARRHGFPAEHRLTLKEVRRNPRADQRISPEDLIPVPCHPDALAMAYALKLAGKSFR